MRDKGITRSSNPVELLWLLLTVISEGFFYSHWTKSGKAFLKSVFIKLMGGQTKNDFNETTEEKIIYLKDIRVTYYLKTKQNV